VLTVVLSVAAALSNAFASILQRRGAGSVPDSKSMRLSLLLDVLRRPIWLLGLLAMAFGFLFQAAALASGDLALVQPILLAELPITLLLSPLFFEQRAGRRAWLGVVAVCGGLALLLAVASPTQGHGKPDTVGMLLMSGATGGFVALLAFAGLRLRGSARAAAFGAAAGAGFALTAALMKRAMDQITASGIGAGFAHWEIYAMFGAGGASLFLWQNALQSGSLVAAQPPVVLVDPVLSMVIGIMLFHEHVRAGGWIGAELVGALIVAVGSVELSRSPLVSGGDEEAAQDEAQPDEPVPADQPDRM